MAQLPPPSASIELLGSQTGGPARQHPQGPQHWTSTTAEDMRGTAQGQMPSSPDAHHPPHQQRQHHQQQQQQQQKYQHSSKKATGTRQRPTSEPPDTLAGHSATRAGLISRTVHLRCLPTGMTQSDLGDIIHGCGGVCRVRICGNAASGQKWLYGFVEYARAEDAEQLLRLAGLELPNGPGRPPLRLKCSKAMQPIVDIMPHDANVATGEPCSFGRDEDAQRNTLNDAVLVVTKGGSHKGHGAHARSGNAPGGAGAGDDEEEENVCGCGCAEDPTVRCCSCCKCHEIKERASKKAGGGCCGSKAAAGGGPDTSASPSPVVEAALATVGMEVGHGTQLSSAVGASAAEHGLRTRTGSAVSTSAATPPLPLAPTQPAVGDATFPNLSNLLLAAGYPAAALPVAVNGGHLGDGGVPAGGANPFQVGAFGGAVAGDAAGGGCISSALRAMMRPENILDGQRALDVGCQMLQRGLHHGYRYIAGGSSATTESAWSAAMSELWELSRWLQRYAALTGGPANSTPGDPNAALPQRATQLRLQGQLAAALLCMGRRSIAEALPHLDDVVTTFNMLPATPISATPGRADGGVASHLAGAALTPVARPSPDVDERSFDPLRGGGDALTQALMNVNAYPFLNDDGEEAVEARTDENSNSSGAPDSRSGRISGGSVACGQLQRRDENFYTVALHALLTVGLSLEDIQPQIASRTFAVVAEKALLVLRRRSIVLDTFLNSVTSSPSRGVTGDGAAYATSAAQPYGSDGPRLRDAIPGLLASLQQSAGVSSSTSSAVDGTALKDITTLPKAFFLQLPKVLREEEGGLAPEAWWQLRPQPPSHLVSFFH